MPMPITVLYNQTLADITLQACGDLEQWFAMAQLNGMAITDGIEAGEVIETTEPASDKRQVTLRLQAIDNRPATGDEYNVDAYFGGIGYMQIGNNFMVGGP